jgi:hypothetical protein
MTWLNASEQLAIEAAARARAGELRATASVAVAADAVPHGRAGGVTSSLRAGAALVLGLIGLAAAASAGCVARSLAVEPRAGVEAPSASPSMAGRGIPECRGMGPYNRAANLCVSEGP